MAKEALLNYLVKKDTAFLVGLYWSTKDGSDWEEMKAKRFHTNSIGIEVPHVTEFYNKYCLYVLKPHMYYLQRCAG